MGQFATLLKKKDLAMRALFEILKSVRLLISQNPTPGRFHTLSCLLDDAVELLEPVVAALPPAEPPVEPPAA